MGLFKKLFGRKKKHAAEEWNELEEDSLWQESMKSGEGWDQEDVDLYQPEEREKYVKMLVERMRDASTQLDELTAEYNLVTGYLTDMEELEALPENEHAALVEKAKKLIHLDHERDDFQGKAGYLEEEEYRRVERMEKEITEGIRKLTETEKYQQTIKRDLKRLDVEKKAFEYRQGELLSQTGNIRGISMIGAVSMGICFVMLLVLQFAFELDTQIGYLILVGVAAVFLAVVYIKYNDAKRELHSLDRSMNKLIILQNRVKIRYVNNTNLLDYLYLKYQVGSAANLIELWDHYQKEKAERERYEKAVADLEYYKKDILNQLKRYHLHDPYIWLHQAEAITNHNEMVEIRHGLIERRQNLRAQLEYNREIATRAENRLKDIIEQFPAFAKNILSLIDLYQDV